MGRGGVPRVGELTSPHPAGGETEEEMLRVDVLENQLMDLRMSFARLCYSPDFVSTPPGRGGAQGDGPPPPPGGSCPHWGHGDKGNQTTQHGPCTPRLAAVRG